MHTDISGSYDGEAVSPFSDTDFVSAALSGVRIVENDLASSIYYRNGVLSIINPDCKNVSVATPDGKSLSLGNAASISWTPASKGIVIVSVGNSSIKIAL